MPRALANKAVVQALLQTYKFVPQRSAGQNFLVCEDPIEKTLAALTPGPRLVTELGAGLGTLTQALLGAKFHVRAIERDQILSQILQKQITSNDNLELVVGDIRREQLSWPSKPYQLVGNIPYNLSGLILRRVTEMAEPPVRAVFMVQQEVGERLTAQPPQMSLLSVAVQLWGTPRRIMKVPAACFWPEPAVDSQLIVIDANSNFSRADQAAIIALAKPFFQTKRKQIAGTLARQFGLSQEEISTRLKAAGILPKQRPQELSLDQWQKLMRQLTFDH